MNRSHQQSQPLSTEKLALLKQRLQQKGLGTPGKSGIQRRQSTSPCPLSFAQQRLWFLDQLEPDSSLYNIPVALHLSGALNRSALLQSLAVVIQRHESLRTTFVVEEGTPVQVIATVAEVHLPVVDLTGLPGETGQIEGQRLIDQEAQQPFNLARGPLLRLTLLYQPGRVQVLLLTLHHIIADGQSMNVLMREINTLYNGFCQGQRPSLPLLPIQYADFAAWQHEWFQSAALEEQKSYWLRQLENLSFLELPTDHPRPTVQGFRGAHQNILIPAACAEKLKALSQQEGATLFMTTLAAFQILLAHYSQQTDIAVGTPITNRNHTETLGVVGLFVNTLVLRLDLSENPAFREVLARVRTVCLDAYSHQDMPFEKLVELLQPERNLSHSPLFQVLFNFYEAGPSGETLDALQVQAQAGNTGTTKFDLALSVSVTSNGLRSSINYSIDLFEDRTIRRMLDHWSVLLDSIVNHPEWPVADLPLLTAEEQQQLLSVSSGSPVHGLPAACLHRSFEQQVARHPDRVALSFQDQCLSYRQLNLQANRLAHWLQAEGVGPEVLVGVCMERSLELIVALLAVLKAGGAYVPLDPTYPQERLSFILQDTQARLVLTQTPVQQRFPATKKICLDPDNALPQHWSDENPRGQVPLSALAYLIYTSGSTGTPKGAMITHQGLSNYIQWSSQYYGVAAGRGSIVHSSLGFDLTITSLFPPLVSGCSVILTPEEQGMEGLLATIRQHPGTSLLKITPAHLDLLSRTLSPRELREATHALVIGGEALSAESLVPWRESAPHVRLINEYGPTETVVGCCIYEVEHNDADAGTIPIGHPIANTQLYILDKRWHQVPMGHTGELYIGGLGLARGYENRADLTAERFIPHPFSAQPGERLYRTGDLARYRPDGCIEFLGRVDQQVKLRGFRIELGEIETILRAHPAVQEAVVLLREEGAERTYLVAYVVFAATDETPTSEQLRAYLSTVLPVYMLPTFFVALAALPLTRNGKVDRRALPAPTPETRDQQAFSGVLPTPLEELLLEIWRAVLGREQIGVHDNFFALGGHSLLATRVISRIQVVFGVHLPLKSLFESPTIAQLAQQIAFQQNPEQWVQIPPIVPVSRTQPLPLSFAQQRLWFLEQLDREGHAYNIPDTLRLQGPLSLAALERSLAEMIRRHEILRTTYALQDGQPVQLVSDDYRFSLPVIDISTQPSQVQLHTLQALLARHLRHAFDLEHGPLLRIFLLRMGPEEHVLLMNMHHSISDGWSLGIFHHELSRLYNALLAHRPSPLPELPIQYGDFARWQQQWLQGDVLATQVNYWTKQLANLACLDLPTDFTRPPVQSFRGAQRGISLPRALRDELTTLSNREGVTLFMTLLAAFQVLLARYTRQYDIAVGTPIANRNHAELEGLIGCFINTLVLRTDLAGNPAFSTLLQRVRKVCLDAYAHQDVPFEKIVEVLQPVRDLSRSPLFQVSFSLHHATRSTGQLQGLTVSRYSQESTTTKFDLTFIVTETEQGLHCLFEYSTDLFEPATIDTLLSHYRNLLTGIVERPARRLSDLPLLTDAELREQLVDWNNTATARPAATALLHAQFEALAKDMPDAVAVVFQDEHFTYAGLNRYANQLARYLLAWGQLSSEPAAEKLVGLLLPRFPAMVIGILGTLKAGGAYLPLDPAYPPERLRYLLQDAQPAILITQQMLFAQVPAEQAKVLCLDTSWPLITQQATSNPVIPVHADTIAYVIYTSGSTGKPKGVLVSHHNAVHSTQARLLYYREAVGRFLLLSSFAFDSSVAGIFWTLSLGGALVLPPDDLLQDVFQLGDFIDEQQISHLLCVPSLYALLLQYGQAKLASLRTAIVAGEACPLALVEQHTRLCPDLPLFNEYGPTEASVWSSVALCAADGQPPSIGGPIANTQIYLLDQSLRLVPRGVTGEVYIGGEGVVRGYLRQPALTAERFIPHPFSETPGARLYKTGDLARYRKDGQIDYLGRNDYQVKIRGYRIEAGEIEAILRARPEIQECVVIAQGEAGNQRLVAYLVVRDQHRLVLEDIRADLSRKLPGYMRPELFIPLDALPLTPNGKVDRQALPSPELWRAGTGGFPATHSAPGTSVEEILAGLWSTLLDRQQVSIHDNFFDLGGHSLLAVRLIAQLQSIFQMSFPLRLLFERPTIAELAAQIEQELQRERGGKLPELASTKREKEIPLSFAQQRLWFIDQLESEQTAYAIPQIIRLSGPFHLSTFALSLTEMTRRHESLRTIFPFRGGQPVQVILPVTPFHLPLVDFSGLPPAACEAEIQRLIQQEATRRFDLAQGPLLRVIVLRARENEHVVVQTVHHIIADGWSLEIFTRETGVLYEAFVAGQPSPLPELPCQYADFAFWQRQWLQGEMLASQLEYWRTQLHGLAPLPLLLDFPRPPLQRSSGAQQMIVLPTWLRDGLVALSQREHVTLFMTLLGAFQVLLARYTGQTDIAVGSPITNRNRAELQGLIGIFVNTLVLRTDLAGNPTFRELLTRVREICLDAYTHQDVPFEKLVEMLQPERDASRSALVQVVFILQQAQEKQHSSTEPTELRLTLGSAETTTAKQELTLALKDTPHDGLQGSIVYSTDLFHAATIQLMIRRFTVLLEQIVANPEWRLFDIPLAADQEHLSVDAASDDDTALFSFE